MIRNLSRIYLHYTYTIITDTIFSLVLDSHFVDFEQDNPQAAKKVKIYLDK